MRLTILGGGGFRVPLVYRAVATGEHAGWASGPGTGSTPLVTDLYLHDVDAARLHAIVQVLEAMPLPPGATPPRLHSGTELDEALVGADVVFAAIRPGGAQGRVADERVALENEVIGQETTGAGGISYALRSVPQMVHVAKRMAALAPDAWLINFTNPAGVVTEALVPILGQRVIGICDSPIGLVRRAAAAASVPLRPGSLAGVDYLGINHLGWLRGLRVAGADDVDGGVDRLPALLADPTRLQSFEEGRVFGPDLPRLLGTIPNEYLFYYYFARESLQALSTGQTRGEFIAEQQRELYGSLAGSRAGSANQSSAFGQWETARRSREEGYLAEARPEAEHRDEKDLAGGGYEQVALELMAALVTGRRTELILNVVNDGTVPALPDAAVIEVPSVADATGARPLPLPTPATGHQAGMMNLLKAVDASVIEACTGRNRDAALRAFALHPLIDSAHLAGRLLDGYERQFPFLAARWR